MSQTNLPRIDTSERLIHGSLLKCIDGRWSTADINEMTGRRLLALMTAKAVQHWQAQGVIQTIVEGPDTPLPDVEQLNAQIPQSEWETGLDGQPRAPFQKEYVVYLLDPSDASLYTFANSTVGAKIAHTRLVDRVSWMRAMRGAAVFPLVVLDAKQMKTKKVGIKLRPEFTIVDWRNLGGPDKLAIAPPTQPTAPGGESAAEPAAPGEPVKAPTAGEVLSDEIPF